MSNKIYQIVTDQIINQPENVDPEDYSKPWFCVGNSPVNLRGTAYCGINHILLSHSGYQSNIVQVAQRSLNYGMLGPIKEMLFTVVGRETKYKSKNFIDTVVYRGSDVAASWLFKGYMTLGLGMGSIVWLYLPVMAIWGLGAWKLGQMYEQLKSQLETSSKVR